MSFHHFKSSEGSGKVAKLSEVVTARHLKNGDLLEVDHLNIFEVDKVPGYLTKVTKVNLSYNRISSLDGLAQFKFLTHLHVSNNLLENIKELEKVQNKEQLVVLSVQNNPVSQHPDLLALSLTIFPRLVELNGVKLTDHARQDFFDALELGKKIVNFISKNEILLESLDKELKTIKNNYKILQTGKKISESETESNQIRRLNLPVLPNYSHYSKIRPYMIIDFTNVVGKAIHYFLPDEVESELTQKCFKWLFCEILLNLNSWGNHNLQLFLQKYAGDPDPDACFLKQVTFFQSLKFKLKGVHKFSDIFPNESIKSLTRSQMLDSYLENTEDWSTFPIFSGNSDYLKALYTVLQGQYQLIEELQREKEEILSFDSTVLHVPGFIDKFNEGTRVTSYDFSQDLRASSRTTVKRFNSPINSSYSPQDLKDELTEEKPKIKISLAKTPEQEAEENAEKNKLRKLKSEIEAEKNKLEQKIKEDEENRKKELKKIEDNFRETQKKMENVRKKVLGLTEKAGIMLQKLFFERIQRGFQALKQELNRKKGEKSCQVQKAEEFYKHKLMKKCFDPLRYFQILSKSKRIKAENYYSGRVLLDSFFGWKNLTNSTKLEKKKQEKLKQAEKEKKRKEKESIKKDFEKLLKQVTHNEKNIKKLWKALKNNTKASTHDCLCGGFKCQVCVQEKSTFIRQELKAIKLKIAESRRK